MPDTLTNHPVDALAEVRLKIRQYEKEEEALKAAVLALPEDDRVGRWCEAVVRTTETRRVDLKQLTEALGEEYIAGFKVAKEVTTVVTKQLEQSE